jgi:subtilase family serine protease
MNRTPAIPTLQGIAATLCSFALFLAPSTAQAAQHYAATSHVPEAVSSGVAPLVGHLPSQQRLSLAISLPLQNQVELDDLIEQLYDPQSPNFHKYLSVEEFASRFGPAESDYAAVQSFARANGLAIIDTAANRMVVDVEGPAATIESAFHVSLGVYQHPTEGRTFYAPDREPTVDLDAPLLHISGLDNFSLPHAKNFISSATTKSTGGSGPGGSFLGSDLRTAYYGSGSLNGAGQSVAIFELSPYALSDIQLYFRNAHQTLKVPLKNVSVNGARTTCTAPSCNDIEQALDIEQAISMAPGLSQLAVYVGSSNVSVFNQMAADNTSKQISCSYGWSDNESSLDPIFQEMAAQGQSVFVATGDQGFSTPANVVWPSDDPYVTAVGGTDLTTKTPGGAWASETGWEGSAGMPSKNNVPIPSYQKLAGVITASNHGSTTLRNIPDVASESNDSQYVCAEGICKEQGGGTSYAAPLWAGLAAMINQQSIAHGGTTIGFLNPLLYAIGTGASFTTDFHDITSGDNGKYSAVKGYDLVTGWGSPNAAALINVLAESLVK